MKPDIRWTLPKTSYKLPSDLPYEVRMKSIALRTLYWHKMLTK